MLDVQEESGKAVASEIDGVFARADVTNEAEVRAAVEAAEELAPLRVLVNCAGLGRAGRTVDRDGLPYDLSTFEFVVGVNLVGTFNCIRLAASAMHRTEPLADGERGAIVNTASVAAFEGQIGQASYSASKGGVVGMTLPIARDLAAIGVRVNTVAPGLLDTPIFGKGETADSLKQRLGEGVVFPRRLGRGDEFASLVLELVTNSYINAEVVRLDGALRLPPRS